MDEKIYINNENEKKNKRYHRIFVAIFVITLETFHVKYRYSLYRPTIVFFLYLSEQINKLLTKVLFDYRCSQGEFSCSTQKQ